MSQKAEKTATKWVKFKEAGAPHGYAYVINDVVELPENKAKKLYADSVCIPAEEEEIAAAKAIIEKEGEIEVTAAEEMQAVLETNAALQTQIVEMQKQIDALKSKK